MSWNPFGKNSSSSSSSSSSTRRSVFTKSLDRDIEREHRKLEHLEETTKKLQKDLKKCNESTHEFAAANLKVVATLKTSSLYAKDADFAGNVDRCFAAAKEVETAANSVVAVTTKTAVEPTKKLATVFPAANAEVRRRREKSEELEKLQAKVEKLREKERTGPNIVKLDLAEKQLGQVKQDFDHINDSLLRDFGEFDQRKTEYFQPSVEALMCAEALFFKDMSNSCEKALVGMSATADSDCSQDIVQQKLNEIKTLS